MRSGIVLGMATYPTVTLKAGRSRSIEGRHPWIFSGALEKIPDDIPSGSIVDVRSGKEGFLARGFFNPHSQISVRILTFKSEEIDASFFSQRIGDALSLRLAYYADALKDPQGALRLIYAESDGLPGLIVDRYADVLVTQFLSAGMKAREKVIIQILSRQLSPKTIYEKSRGSGKDEEGIGHRDGLIFGEPLKEPVIIRENDLRFYVDILAGQKTGFYLDLREVRKFVRDSSTGKIILNVGCYTGSISMAALLGGAEHVISVDSSENPFGILEKNLELGNYEKKRHQSVHADMFEYLRKAKDRYDLIILDPPAFAQRQKDIAQAVKGYKDLHVSAFKCLRKGGELITLCCSHHIDRPQFEQIIFYTLKDLKISAHTVHHFNQPPDHPINPLFPEGTYFKGFVIRKS